MLTPELFTAHSLPDMAADVVALAIAVLTLGGLVWGVVMRATKPLRDRLNEIHGIAEGLAAERERVDDLNDRVAGLERRLGGIERRIEDLHHLILTLIPLIDPCRMRRDQHAEPDDK